uniref:NADH dehydrogenase subunit 5 n=1 Tax=Blastothrix speciosa TaxID=3064204 RepID=UPI00286B1FEA|nr:NADH dehydrogenase subunit 5 [Blastothrix speciosa]WKV28879.1 NADH dehydrogenase subunit 5 [Blastothrix speciosa]
MMYYYLSGIFFFFFKNYFFFLSLLFLLDNLIYFIEWNLMFLNSMNLNMLIFLDWMTLIFIFTVLLISSMIMFYCCEYMHMDNYQNRFFFLVTFFIFSMVLMIISPNMVSIILGWDGLGLTSFCLVIYYNNFYSMNSGMLTVLMNRVGDVMIMFSISMMMILGSWNFMNLNFLNLLILIFVMFAAFTKSAQFPFSSWLPAAMAAPTPVSSLVHSSTLVTAGIYLLIRFNYLIYKNNLILNYIVVIGMMTMFYAGLCAIFEFDIKKIIAYSTLSQLGLMMVIYGMKFFMISFFHLIIHAMFKSTMFMCSGVVIHSMNNIQDIRFMGNMFEFMPLTMITFMISNLSLCGMPFFSGFFSKDLILEMLFMSKFNLILLIFLLLSTMLTVIYSIRLLYYLSYSYMNMFVYFNTKDLKLMNFSMIFLLINTLIFGFIFNWLLFMNIECINLFLMEKILILILMFFSIFIGKKIYNIKFKKNMIFKLFFGKMCLLNNLVFFLNKLNFKIMKLYYYLFDKGSLNFMFEYLILENLKFIKLNFLNINFINKFMMLISIIMLFIFFI